MKPKKQPSQTGIALILVLLVIVMLGILAGGFAYSMKVETTLARNATFDAELEWLGRSGVELARYILSQEGLTPGGQVDSLKMRWAGGPGETNDVLAALPMQDYQLGSGSFSIRIVDLDRKFNINTADRVILQEALAQVGLTDAALASTIVDSILDWRDRDDTRGMSGTESDDYATQPNEGYPPYLAKNGPMDDLSELLMVRGITPAMYWGSSAGTYSTLLRRRASPSALEEPVYATGLADLFCALSSGRLNINTASAATLQVIPGIDENAAHAILSRRAGPDGMDGTEDDTPFRSPAEFGLGLGPGPGPNPFAQFAQLFTVRSLVFEVQVDARIGHARRQYIAHLRRNGPRDIQILTLHWRNS